MPPSSILQNLADVARAQNLGDLRQKLSPWTQDTPPSREEQDLFNLSPHAHGVEQKFASWTFLTPLCNAGASMLRLLACAGASDLDPLLRVSAFGSVLVAAASSVLQ
jgi:hypothetical protein